MWGHRVCPLGRRRLHHGRHPRSVRLQRAGSSREEMVVFLQRWPTQQVFCELLQSSLWSRPPGRRFLHAVVRRSVGLQDHTAVRTLTEVKRLGALLLGLLTAWPVVYVALFLVIDYYRTQFATLFPLHRFPPHWHDCAGGFALGLLPNSCRAQPLSLARAAFLLDHCFSCRPLCH